MDYETHEREEHQQKLRNIVNPPRIVRQNSVKPAASFRISKVRNKPCPCMSGKKFKACHGQGTSSKYVTLRKQP
jgi:uncharacterized protein YecA (UPF0149 family)